MKPITAHNIFKKNFLSDTASDLRKLTRSLVLYSGHKGLWHFSLGHRDYPSVPTLSFNRKLNGCWGPQIAQSSPFCKESQSKEIKRSATPAYWASVPNKVKIFKSLQAQILVFNI